MGRTSRMVLTMAAAVSMTALAACNSDDGGTDPTSETTAESTTTEAPETTEPPTTSAPPTTELPTTPPPTTPPTTPTPTTSPEDALKAQIAADYELSRELLEQLTANPTLEDLDARMAEIAAPGTPVDASIRAFVTGMVQNGERVIFGTPDYSTVDVEQVELVGSAPFAEAIVTYCDVSNRVRIDAAGNVFPETEGLIAARRTQPVTLTASGVWLPRDGVTSIAVAGEVTQCPA